MTHLPAPTSNPGEAVRASVREDLTFFLCQHTKKDVTADVDLFAAGLVSSLFALELVVHLESTYAIAVPPEELKLDNFRTVTAMSELVVRLRGRK
jgi:methoxymalonate biosynthesis acyl carrier protein